MAATWLKLEKYLFLAISKSCKIHLLYQYPEENFINKNYFIIKVQYLND